MEKSIIIINNNNGIPNEKKNVVGSELLGALKNKFKVQSAGRCTSIKLGQKACVGGRFPAKETP